MILLLKASLVVIFLLSFYKLFLERESFFTANRAYLLGCLALACILPFVVLPKMSQHQGYVDNVFETVSNTNEESTEELASVDPSLHPNERQSPSDDVIIISRESNLSSGESDVHSAHLEPASNEIVAKEESSMYSLMFWLKCLYLFGVIVLAVRFVAQLFNVWLKVLRNTDQIEDEDIVIVNMEGDVEPCSFFKYVFINPALYDFDTYEQIIAHERIHVSKRHTIDLLLAEVAIIVLWFNPFAWMLRNEVEKNIEYQTDQTLISSESEEKKAYQLNLVKIACDTSPMSITTNYNQSLIKQRILKMNAKKSNQFNYWKYAFCMPLVFVLLLILNRPTEALATTHKGIPEMSEQTMKREDLISNFEDEDLGAIGGDLNMHGDEKMLLNADMQCKEFEDAVAEGDLQKVKELLETIDSDCLSIMGEVMSNLEAAEKLIDEKKRHLEYEAKQKAFEKFVGEGSTCERLWYSVKNESLIRTRDILQNEDISCIGGKDGKPTSEMALIKGLLSYGAQLRILDADVIKIDGLFFEIGIDDTEAIGCEDPNYMALVDAINDFDESKIRKILSESVPSCPLNVNGVRNDFIFINEMMKYEPKIINLDNLGIRIGGVGVEMNLGQIEMLFPQSTEKEMKEYRTKADLLHKLQKRLNEHSEEVIEESCLTLIDAIEVKDYYLTEDILKTVNPNCFHMETTTVSDGEDRLVISTITTPLLTAIKNHDIGLVKALLDHNADVNYVGDGKETPLIAAVKIENKLIVKLLLENGARLNESDSFGMTALQYAKTNENDELIHLLESGESR